MLNENKQKLMKIVRCLSFSILFIYMFIRATYILRLESDMKQRFSGYYAEMPGSLDVVYIGSSPVHPYWAAPLAWNDFGFTSYPLATNIQQPKATYFLLKEALKYQHPKVAIFELRMFITDQVIFDDTSDAFIRNVTDNIKLSKNRNEMIKEIVSKDRNRINFYFDISMYHNRWKVLKWSDLKYWNFSKEDIRRGHLIMSDVVDLSKEYNDYGYVTDINPIPPEQEYYLREIMNLCKQNNVNALFTVNPFTEITEETQKQFNYMEKLITKESEYSFINFNLLYKDIGIDFGKDFYNSGHMNILGAEKFTAYLGNYLTQHYNLVDKRSDKAYERWDNAFAAWRIKADEAKSIIEEKIRKGEYD